MRGLDSFCRNLALSTILSGATGKIYLNEDFEKGWKENWVESTDWKSASEMGTWKWVAGENAPNKSDKGIKTGEDARFYGISAKLNEPFTNDGDKELVLQYTVKYDQDIDCGGSYIKLMGPDVDQESFGGDSPYQIMFGPDVCGSTRRTHVIFNYPPKDDNLLINGDVKTEVDKITHLYTLVVRPDETFEVFIDQESVRSGKLSEEFDFLPPKEIKDPKESKPKDWVDEAKIPDPEDIKPEGYDDIPAEIPDPDAEKPDDWDDEEDGEWEPPMIDNPEYEGPWTPKMIDNPDYKGPWIHPMIPNPDFKEDADLAIRCKECTHVGFELWQVKAGTVFDKILVSDSFEEAEAIGKDIMKAIKKEKAVFEKAEEERRAREQAEMEAAKAEAGEEDDEDDYGFGDEYDDEEEEDRDEL